MRGPGESLRSRTSGQWAGVCFSIGDDKPAASVRLAADHVGQVNVRSIRRATPPDAALDDCFLFRATARGVQQALPIDKKPLPRRSLIRVAVSRDQQFSQASGWLGTRRIESPNLG